VRVRISRQTSSIKTSCAADPESTMSVNGPCTIRPGRRDDAEALLAMIKDLAEYEKELDQVKMTVQKLQFDGWPLPEEVAAGHQARFETLFAEVEGEIVGFALWFHNYSTWEGMGIYLEDLYVKPAHRGKGVGTALMKAVAVTAQQRDCCRFQWQAIDFNSPAIEYYKTKLGARERMETGNAKWVNFIMDRSQIAAFVEAK
jgi:diamine N-acetyltransferase